MPAATKKKIGRPRKPDSEKRRNNITLRLRDDTRHRLEEAAASQGRSLSEENEFRLERSFSQEDDLYERFGGVGQYRWMLMLSLTFQMIENETGKKWDKDLRTNTAAREAVNEFMERFSPKPRKGLRLNDLLPVGDGARLAKHVLDSFAALVNEHNKKS